MPAVLEPVDTATSSNDRDDDMTHLFCTLCGHTNVTLCGRVLDEVEIIEGCGEELVECVVCAAMIWTPCPICGA